MSARPPGCCGVCPPIVGGGYDCTCTDNPRCPNYTPKRIQRKRTKGWRMPEGTIYVGRPTKWGNPWQVGPAMSPAGAVWRYNDAALGRLGKFTYGVPDVATIRAELRGHDLACWCPIDAPCHADVLLELANP